MKKINVLVTGAGGGGIGEQIIKALRSGENDYYIGATDIRKDSVAVSISDVFFKVPMANSENYCLSLIKLCKKFHFNLLIPGSEPELNVIASNIDLFSREGIHVPINSIKLIELCSDKILFNDFLKENNFPYAETFELTSKKIPKEIENFPYVLKPTSGSGSKDVFIVQNKMEMHSVLNYLSAEKKFILQEYVGNYCQEYTVGILCTPKMGYVNHIILKRDLSLGLSVKQSVKNKTSRINLGDRLVVSTGISQGEFVSNNQIDDVVMKIVELLSPVSSINLQCRVHENKVFIFEVNPRFSGTTNLRAKVGFNEPEFLINEFSSIPNIALLSSKWKNKKVLRGLKEYIIK